MILRSLLGPLLGLALLGCSEPRDRRTSGGHAGAAHGGERDGGDALGDAATDASTRTCSPAGTWEIHYDSNERCWPKRDERVSILTPDEDAGTAPIDPSLRYTSGEPSYQVVFEGRSLVKDQCVSGSMPAAYRTTLQASDSGCRVTAKSEANWCSGNEPQCENLELVLAIDSDKPDTATVSGTYRKCWCTGTWSTGWQNITGTATRVSE